MSTRLLEIQPKELKFIFELKKASTCTVRLANNTYDNVAFKVKTTSPMIFSVRPNVGVISPKSTCEVTVTMRAPEAVPVEMVSKDKFLIQSTVVPAGTTDNDISITPNMFPTFRNRHFIKNDGKIHEDFKLRVAFISPPESPILSPTNGVLNQGPFLEPPVLRDPVLNKFENSIPPHPAVENVEMEKNAELKSKKSDTVVVKPTNELKIVCDIEEMKTKLNVLESKLNEAESTISKFSEERRLSIQERKSLQEELAVLRSKTSVKKVEAGFPLLFAVMVALISIFLILQGIASGLSSFLYRS